MLTLGPNITIRTGTRRRNCRKPGSSLPPTREPSLRRPPASGILLDRRAVYQSRVYSGDQRRDADAERAEQYRFDPGQRLTAELHGNWSNSGTITATNSTVNLGGTFTPAGIGTFIRSGGTVTINGTVNNTGTTFDLSALSPTTGSILLNSGHHQWRNHQRRSELCDNRCHRCRYAERCHTGDTDDN